MKEIDLQVGEMAMVDGTRLRAGGKKFYVGTVRAYYNQNGVVQTHPEDVKVVLPPVFEVAVNPRCKMGRYTRQELKDRGEADLMRQLEDKEMSLKSVSGGGDVWCVYRARTTTLPADEPDKKMMGTMSYCQISMFTVEGACAVVTDEEDV